MVPSYSLDECYSKAKLARERRCPVNGIIRQRLVAILICRVLEASCRYLFAPPASGETTTASSNLRFLLIHARVVGSA